MYCDYYLSPLGMMEIKASEVGVRHVIFCGDNIAEPTPNTITKLCISQLQEYFAKARTQFDVPLDTIGTEFQKAVWQALTQIPYGEVWSYGQLAEHLQNPKAVRAVGGANGRNPITLIVPCHRVIGASGKMTGYAGGVERKQWLLAHENNSGQYQKPDLPDSVFQQRQDKTQFLN